MTTPVPTPPWWQRLLNRLSSSRQASAVQSITHNDQIVCIERHKRGKTMRAEMAWKDVTTAIAFKRGCYTVDLICIALVGADGSLEVNEEMSGWKGLVEALPGYLPGCLAEHEWFQQVAFPAFATNLVHIFRRVTP